MSESHPLQPAITSGVVHPDHTVAHGALSKQFVAAFLAAGKDWRAGVLAQLRPHVGTLALLVIGNGIFARFAAASPPVAAPLTAEEAAQVDADTITDLVHYLEQREPQLVQRVLSRLEVGAI